MVHTQTPIASGIVARHLMAAKNGRAKKINRPPCICRRIMVSYAPFSENRKSDPCRELKSRKSQNPICPPLWVYASAHRSDPIRRGLYHAQMEVRPHESDKRDAEADRYNKRRRARRTVRRHCERGEYRACAFERGDGCRVQRHGRRGLDACRIDRACGVVRLPVAD